MNRLHGTKSMVQNKQNLETQSSAILLVIVGLTHLKPSIWKTGMIVSVRYSTLIHIQESVYKRKKDTMRTNITLTDSLIVVGTKHCSFFDKVDVVYVFHNIWGHVSGFPLTPPNIILSHLTRNSKIVSFKCNFSIKHLLENLAHSHS